MAFTFNYKYTKTLNHAFTREDIQKALTWIEKFVKQKGANSTTVEDSMLTYQGSIINRTPVHKGIFQIENTDFETKITYEIIVNLAVVIIPFVSVILGIVARNIFMPIYCSFLVAAGFLVTLARYGDMLDDIKEGIDNLLSTSEPIENEEIIHTN